MNIIYEVESKSLRPIGLTSRETYQLNELNFYIPKTHKNITPFLLIKDSNGKKDILKLSHSKADKVYNIYSVDFQNFITINQGNCAIALLILSNNIEISTSESMILDFSNFSLGQQANLVEGLSQNLVAMYQKVEKLTKMNIQLYKDIEEALKP